jgi:putative restriction endonuclease
MKYNESYLERIRNLNINRNGERRAPHKPLLLLVAIARLLKGKRELPFTEAKSVLIPLLENYAPQVIRHQPELPYWHLRSDALWEIPNAEHFPLQKGGFPRMAALKSSSGHLEDDFAEALLTTPHLIQATVNILLEDHFPVSIHEDILAAVELNLSAPEGAIDRPMTTYSVKRRDPKFRLAVLKAYGYRCAITNFGATLSGTHLGCEAAHIQWHAHDGPDSVDNGLAIEPTLHKLFDVGAWTLSDDRRVIVSAKLKSTDTDDTIDRICGLHGKPIRSPFAGSPPVSIEYIRWHREPELGGVFKHPALPL